MTRRQPAPTAHPAPYQAPDGVLINLPPLALDTVDAAAYLALEASTLEDWRCQDDRGPKFRRFGRRVVYLVEDLDAWARSHPAFGNTTQADLAS